jgi:formylglycine-generating enzyme required for sulfatase activity
MRQVRFCAITAQTIAVVFLLTHAGSAFSEVTFDWVKVGNPANAADPLNEAAISNIGVVDRNFRMSRFPVTNDQYAEFLNAVGASNTGGLGQLWIEAMGSDPRGGITRSGSNGSYAYAVKQNMGNKPVNLVSFLSAMRFVNWIHNGQPTGAQDASTTEAGVYSVANGVTETRAEDAAYFIPTENEWYKAAYHQPAAEGGDSDNYWLYSTASNDTPTMAIANASGDISNPGANVANYGRGADWNGQDGNVTTVGSAGAGSQSFYGTADQSGNVLEWTETFFQEDPNPGCASPPCSRVVRGGSWDNNADLMRSSFQTSFGVQFGDQRLGFRVAAPASFVINAGLNDAWFNPNTSGQGFFITVFPDLGYVSMAWFTYDTELPPIGATANLGDPGHRWLTAVGPINGNQVLMNIELTSGGIFDTSTEITRTDPPGSDGTIILTFDGCNSGTVEYDIPSIDRQGIVPIQRVVNDNIALCEALN